MALDDRFAGLDRRCAYVLDTVDSISQVDGVTRQRAYVALGPMKTRDVLDTAFSRCARLTFVLLPSLWESKALHFPSVARHFAVDRNLKNFKFRNNSSNSNPSLASSTFLSVRSRPAVKHLQRRLTRPSTPGIAYRF